MEFNKPVSNPMLVGAIELLKTEDTEQHRGMLWKQIVDGEFMAPAQITPKPTMQNGRLTIAKGSNVLFPVVKAPDGRQFLMAYTDRFEFEKYREGEEKFYFALTFDDYISMLLQKGPNGEPNETAGFVINPHSGNIVLTKDMLATLIAQRD